MDIRAFISSLLFALIIGLIALMMLMTDGADAGRIRVDIVIGMDPTEVPATAAPPTPTLPPTAVPPTPTAVPPTPTAVMISQPTTVATRHWFFAAPADWYGSEMTYCHDAARVWTAEERDATRSGFEVWAETGVTFREVAFSLWPNECLVRVMASDAPGLIDLGQGTIGVTPGIQSWVWSNTAQMPHNHYVVAHEVGHVFGLGHVDGPELMNAVIQYVERPSAENINQARAYWFGQ